MKLWTVLVYVAADVPERDMRQYAAKSLEQMRIVGSPRSIDVAAQADFTDRPTERYWFPCQPDPTYPDVCSCIQQTLKNVNSGSKAALFDFLKWGTTRYPARNYMFVFWGHGYGLDDYNPFPKHLVDLLRFDPSAYTKHGTHTADVALDKGTLKIDLKRDMGPVSNSMPDFTSKSVLLNSDIGDVLRRINADLLDGQRVEVIGMDACTMAMAEVWYEMVEGASVAIGSEFSIPLMSWPYDLILAALAKKPHMSPSELATATIDCYVRYYSQPKFRGNVTLSACKLSLGKELAESVKRLVALILPHCDEAEFRRTVFHARKRTLQFDSAGFIDLRNFCDLLRTDVANGQIAAASERVTRTIDSFVIARKSVSSDNSNFRLAKGLSVYFPEWIENYNPRSSIQRGALEYLNRSYNGLRFVRLTGWNLFLQQMCDSTYVRRARLKEESMAKKKGKGRTNPKGRKAAKKKT